MSKSEDNSIMHKHEVQAIISELATGTEDCFYSEAESIKPFLEQEA
jgi:hypothetical protein